MVPVFVKGVLPSLYEILQTVPLNASSKFASDG